MTIDVLYVISEKIALSALQLQAPESFGAEGSLFCSDFTQKSGHVHISGFHSAPFGSCIVHLLQAPSINSSGRFVMIMQVDCFLLAQATIICGKQYRAETAE